MPAPSTPGGPARWWRTSCAGDWCRRWTTRFAAPDPARRADVSGATVAADLVVRVPGIDVEEIVTIDAHPLDDGPVSVTAREAGLRLVAGDPVEPWVDRVVAVLALRVAAEME